MFRRKKIVEPQYTQEELEQMKREKELAAKSKIRKTLNSMKNQLKKLEDFKKDYIEKAKQAALIGNEQTYKIAKSGLKICLSKQKFLESMIANFELAVQINDMNKIIGEFVHGVDILSSEMREITSTFDLTKAQMAYDDALLRNESQYSALDSFLETAANSIESLDGLSSNVSDEEIDKLISNQAVDSESAIDDEIKSKIDSIKEKMAELN